MGFVKSRCSERHILFKRVSDRFPIIFISFVPIWMKFATVKAYKIY
jgi:hypothetical protein